MSDLLAVLFLVLLVSFAFQLQKLLRNYLKKCIEIKGSFIFLSVRFCVYYKRIKGTSMALEVRSLLFIEQATSREES
jgi:hypothetical protein